MVIKKELNIKEILIQTDNRIVYYELPQTEGNEQYVL